jgi:hypothetical protein
MSMFLNESRQGIEQLAAEVCEASDCDINLYIIAPPASGGAQFCQQLEALSGGRFRFASASIAARAANDRAQSRLGRLELVRKAALTDIASLWGKEEQVSDAVRLKFDTDLCEFDQLQQLEEMARPKNGAPRFRILEGSVFDASLAPVQTCNRIPLLSDLAKMGLELSANNTWERWTRTAPVSSSLFVYIKYDMLPTAQPIRPTAAAESCSRRRSICCVIWSSSTQSRRPATT